MPLFEPMGDLRTRHTGRLGVQRPRDIDPRVRRKSGHDPVRQARWCHIKSLTIQGDRDSSMYLLRTGTRSVGSCRERMRRRLGGWGEVVGKRIFWTFRSPLNLAEPHWISPTVVALFAACRAPKEGGGGEVEWRRRRVSIPEKAKPHTQKKKKTKENLGL